MRESSRERVTSYGEGAQDRELMRNISRERSQERASERELMRESSGERAKDRELRTKSSGNRAQERERGPVGACFFRRKVIGGTK